MGVTYFKGATTNIHSIFTYNTKNILLLDVHVVLLAIEITNEKYKLSYND